MDWTTLLFIEDNELQYELRRRLVEQSIREEDYEPAITDYSPIGETAEEFYRNNWLDESREDMNGRPY